MSSVNYPLWYGLPRGVELRPDGKPSPSRPAGHQLAIPWGMQLTGLLVTMLAGIALIALHFEMIVAHPLREDLRGKFLASEAGIAYVRQGMNSYLIPVGIAFFAGGAYLAARTRFLRTLGESDPLTKVFAVIYLAPTVVPMLLMAGMTILFIAGLALFGIIMAICLLIGILGAIGAAGS